MNRVITAALSAALLVSAFGCSRPAAGGEGLRLSAEGADAAEPAVAAGPAGTACVAWVEHRGKDSDVMFVRVGGDLKPQGSPVRVNPEAGRATAWRGDPPTVATAPDGTVYVGWTARVESPSGQADDLYLSASRDGGQTFGAPVKVNDDQRPAVHGMHSLAVADDGRVLLAWLDERDVAQPQPSEMAEGHHMESNREVFTAYSADGGRTFSPNKRIATDACPCCKTALAIGPENRLYVSWRQVLPGDFRHIAVSSSTDGGESYSPPVIVSDDRWQIAGCPVSGPALAVAPDGTLSVLWYSEGAAGGIGLYRSASHDGGRTFAPRQVLSNVRASGTPTLLGGNGEALTAVWGMGGGDSPHLMAAKVGGDGRTTEDTVRTNGELPSAAAVRGRLLIAFVSKSDGRRGVWLTPGVG